MGRHWCETLRRQIAPVPVQRLLLLCPGVAMHRCSRQPFVLRGRVGRKKDGVRLTSWVYSCCWDPSLSFLPLVDVHLWYTDGRRSASHILSRRERLVTRSIWHPQTAPYTWCILVTSELGCSASRARQGKLADARLRTRDRPDAGVPILGTVMNHRW